MLECCTAVFCVGGVPGLVYPVAVVLLLRFAASCLPVFAVHHTHVAFICDASGDFMELRFLACCPCSIVSCLCAKLAWSHSELLIDLVSFVRFNPSVFREWFTVTTHCDPFNEAVMMKTLPPKGGVVYLAFICKAPCDLRRLLCWWLTDSYARYWTYVTRLAG